MFLQCDFFLGLEQVIVSGFGKPMGKPCFGGISQIVVSFSGCCARMLHFGVLEVAVFLLRPWVCKSEFGGGRACVASAWSFCHVRCHVRIMCAFFGVGCRPRQFLFVHRSLPCCTHILWEHVSELRCRRCSKALCCFGCFASRPLNVTSMVRSGLWRSRWCVRLCCLTLLFLFVLALCQS